jgi:hypothetical protein
MTFSNVEDQPHVFFWPFATDIAARENVGCCVNSANVIPD